MHDMCNKSLFLKIPTENTRRQVVLCLVFMKMTGSHQKSSQRMEEDEKNQKETE